MLVLPELGRDGDVNAANGFLNHRSGDPSCRNMWLLAMGAAVPARETDRPFTTSMSRPPPPNCWASRRADWPARPCESFCCNACNTPKVSPALQALIDKGLWIACRAPSPPSASTK